MPRSGAAAKKRREKLAEMLASGQRVSTTEMANHFDVSDMTIRRDLMALETEGTAVRRYGGAVGGQRITFEFSFDVQHRRNLIEKQQIGQVAAERILPGWTVFIDTGTTTLEVAKAIVKRRIECVVYTSSLVIASDLWANNLVELHLIGGQVRRGSPDLVGPGAEAILNMAEANIAFLGAGGIVPDKGCFAAGLEEGRVAKLMAERAGHVVVVADHTKFGQAGEFCYAQMQNIDEFITDANVDPAIVDEIRKQGGRVTVA